MFEPWTFQLIATRKSTREVTENFDQDILQYSIPSIFIKWGRDSSVGIATNYGAGRSVDRIPVWGEVLRTRPDRPRGPPSLLYNAYRVFPGFKTAGTWLWPPTPFYRRGERKSRAIQPLHLWAFVACSRVNLTFTFTIFIYWVSLQLHRLNAHFIFDTYLYHTSAACFDVSHTIFRENWSIYTQKHLLLESRYVGYVLKY